MKIKAKEFVKNNLLNLTAFFIGLVALLTLSIVFGSDVITIIYTIFFLVYLFAICSKLWFAPIFGIVSTGLYIAVSVLSKNWGEVVFNCLVVLPLLAFGIWQYLKNRNKEDVYVSQNKISNKEFLIFTICCLVFCVAFFFVLRELKTPYTILATVCFFFCAIPNYLQLRRDRRMFYFYLLANVFLILLWLMPLIRGEGGGVSMIPVAGGFFFSIVFNSLGAINWKNKGENKNQIGNGGEDGTFSASR